MNAYKDSERSWSGGSGGQRGTGHGSPAASSPAARAGDLGLVGVLRSCRWVRLLLGVVLVVICAAAVPLLAAHASAKSGPVLAASRDLPAGTVLMAADVVSVPASAPSDAVIPAAGLAGLVGRTLRVEAPAGALLDFADLGAFPAASTSVVPLAVKAGQYPANLATGQQVAVFPVAGQSVGAPTTPAAHAAATGLVLQITPVADDQSGTVVIDLQVPLAVVPVIVQAPGVVLVGLDAAGDAP